MYRLLMLAGAVIVAGCATPAPPPGDPRVVLTPDAGVSADPPIIVAGPLLRVSIRLVNPSPADRPVLQTTDWTDVNKLPVRTLMSAPQRLTVPRFGDATIQVIAPNPRAVNFKYSYRTRFLRRKPELGKPMIPPINTRRLLLLAGLVVLPAACVGPVAPTTMIDPRADRSAIGLGLDSRDFESAGAKVVQDMLESGAVNKPAGGRYVLVISRISNDTMQRIDTDQLVKRIRVELLKSGKVVTTTALRVDGVEAEDPMSLRYRQLRDSPEFSQKNVPRSGQREMVAPELSLSGKLMQHNNRLGDGSQRVDYAFQLSLTDLHTGLGLWEGEEPISKRGPNQSVAW